MSKFRFHISTSLDGYVAGPNIGGARLALEQVRAVEAPGVTHIKYGVRAG